MMREIYLDLRGLLPPEPMERVLDALAMIEPGECIRMLIDREPRPLYRILDRNGYRYEVRVIGGYEYEIVIRQEA